jgi:hypothetical protein
MSAYGAHFGLKSDIAEGPKRDNGGLLHHSNWLHSITWSAWASQSAAP